MANIARNGAYAGIGAAFDRLAAIANARNLWPQVRGMVGVYMDDPDSVPESKLRSHAGLVLAEGAPMPYDLAAMNLPGGRIAVMHYKGPYAGLREAQRHLYGVWLPRSADEPRDAPPYAIYLNTPRDTAPEELLTDVCLPLK